MRRLSAPLFVLIVLFNSTDASAGACDAGESGFDDVPDAAIFCKEALWLRNALVTLGCAGNTGSTRVHVPANRWTNVTHPGGPGSMGGLGAQLSPRTAPSAACGSRGRAAVPVTSSRRNAV